MGDAIKWSKLLQTCTILLPDLHLLNLPVKECHAFAIYFVCKLQCKFVFLYILFVQFYCVLHQPSISKFCSSSFNFTLFHLSPATGYSLCVTQNFNYSVFK